MSFVEPPIEFREGALLTGAVLVIDVKRCGRTGDASMGDVRNLMGVVGVGCVERGEVGMAVRGRRRGTGCFFAVATATVLDGEELSVDSDALSRLMGPERFSAS